MKTYSNEIANKDQVEANQQHIKRMLGWGLILLTLNILFVIGLYFK